MTLFDLLETIPRFISRHMFPVYVETPSGKLAEVDRIDFRNGCAGTVLVAHFPPDSTEEFDDELAQLRDEIREAWGMAAFNHEMSHAAQVFNPTGDVISVEEAYRLILKIENLLERMFDDD